MSVCVCVCLSVCLCVCLCTAWGLNYLADLAEILVTESWLYVVVCILFLSLYHAWVTRSDLLPLTSDLLPLTSNLCPLRVTGSSKAEAAEAGVCGPEVHPTGGGSGQPLTSDL